MSDVALKGHNKGPKINKPRNTKPKKETLDQLLARRSADITKKAQDVIDGVDRMPEIIEDDAKADMATGYISQIKKIAKEADNTRIEINAPYLNATNKINALFNAGIRDPLNRATKTAEDRLLPYTTMKEAQAEEVARLARVKAQEEADKAAEEAERLAAANKPFAAQEALIKSEKKVEEAFKVGRAPTGPTIRSSFGGATASTKKEWTGEVENVLELDLNSLRMLIPADALERAVKAFVKAGGRKLAGARIFEKSKLNVR
ncbi:MAG: hypothetical protein V7727_02095 [Sneathiella sp.]